MILCRSRRRSDPKALPDEQPADCAPLGSRCPRSRYLQYSSIVYHIILHYTIIF